MPLVIDAYNLLHAALGPAGRGRDLGVEGVGRLVAEGRYAGQAVTMVCDGTPPTGGRVRHPGVRVVFAGAGRDADGVIEQIIARDTAPARLVVVSSDRRVQAAAKRRRCPSISSEAFLAQLLTDAAAARARPSDPPSPRERVPLGNAEVSHWLAAFGEHAAWARGIPSSPDRVPPRIEPERAVAPRPTSASPRPAAADRADARDARAASQDDPLLAEALEHFRGLSWDDLDMARWLGEHGAAVHVKPNEGMAPRSKKKLRSKRKGA